MDNSDPNTTADELRQFVRRIADVSWALDTALSLQRKAQPGTGYRSSDATGDTRWDASAYAARVKVCHVHAQRVIAEYVDRPARLKQLVDDLWYFLEEVGEDAPDRTERFFALRERVRESGR